MVFLLTLLGSMIICDALFCGDPQRMLAATTQTLHRWQERVSPLIAAGGRHATGRDYRWE
jgi:hypothetical protein